MEDEKKRIDPESRNYDLKKDIDLDPRFKICLHELCISFGVFAVFATVMLYVVFIVGDGDSRKFNYIFGIPEWYFWVFVVCAVTAVTVSIILDKFFTHMSLESIGEIEKKKK